MLLFLLEAQLIISLPGFVIIYVNITEVNFNSSVLQYEVLETLEFTSDRKRMSVVLQDCQNGKILLLSKGADEALLPYARSGKTCCCFSVRLE